MSLKKKFIDLLVCPKCKREISFMEGNDTKEDSSNSNGFFCHNCHIEFQVNNSIPILMINRSIEQARKE